MKTRILISTGKGSVSTEAHLPAGELSEGWVWTDVLIERDDDIAELLALTAGLRFDAVAVRDAVDEIDLPKVDDFGYHLLVILHGLHEDRIDTYQIDCFVTERHLVTVHRSVSPALDALWSQLQASAELAAGGVDELVARLADILSRRLLSVLDAFEDRADDLIVKALTTDPQLLADLMAVRVDLAVVRRVIHPQREALDLLRHSTSPLLTAAGRRRFSDVFDVASRSSQGLEAARNALAEIFEVYRGSEARKATEVTKVLTIYAAIMLPLSLVAGFFGMNFSNLPGLDGDVGWVIVTVGMFIVAAASLGIFIALGWIKRPSGRRAGAALGRGLVEAARGPVQIVGALYEVSTTPLRATVARRSKSPRRQADPRSEASELE